MCTSPLWAEIVSALRDTLRLIVFLPKDTPESKRPRRGRGRFRSDGRD